MVIAIGSDHGGFSLKDKIIKHLTKNGHEVIDCGTNCDKSCDYPDIAYKIACKVNSLECDRAIAICGSGIGISIALNKFNGIRAALCTNEEVAKLSSQHNNANVLCLGGRFLKTNEAIDIVEAWFTAKFEGDRHQRRIDKIKDIENKKPFIKSGAIGTVNIMTHPLILHKISIMRDEKTTSLDFRNLLEEISLLMGYEVTRELKLTKCEIKTPIAKTSCFMLDGKTIAIVPILRAGLGMVSGLSKLVPNAPIGHIGCYRDEATHNPVEYYCKLPTDISQREVILLDPMLATGGSAVMAIDFLKKRGVKNIKFMCLVAAPEGIKKLHSAHPDVTIYAGALDEKLDKNCYIVPGLGDAGDRLFGTK